MILKKVNINTSVTYDILMAKITKIIKVRYLGANKEHIINVPKEVDGYLSMHYDQETGVLTYVPVKEKMVDE
jgi:hypothetical protein